MNYLLRKDAQIVLSFIINNQFFNYCFLSIQYQLKSLLSALPLFGGRQEFILFWATRKQENFFKIDGSGFCVAMDQVTGININGSKKGLRSKRMDGI